MNGFCMVYFGLKFMACMQAGDRMSTGVGLWPFYPFHPVI